MAYTRDKLEHILNVYREAELGQPKPQSQRHLREDYNLRQLKTTNLNHAAAYQDDANSSADEYDPNTPIKRRSIGNGAKQTPKRLEPDQPSFTTRGRTYVAVKDKDDVAGFVTLRYNGEGSKAKLEELAEEYGDGGDSDPEPYGGLFMAAGGFGPAAELPPHEQERWHLKYLERLDLESAQIDNTNGRALRNRKIPDRDPKIDKCTACKKARARCSLKNNGQFPCTRCQKREIECVRANIDRELATEATPAHPHQQEAGKRNSLQTDLEPLIAANTTKPPSSVPTSTPGERSLGENSPCASKTPPSSADTKQWHTKVQPSPAPGQSQIIDWSDTKRASQIIRSHVLAQQCPFTTPVGGSKINPIVIGSPPASPPPPQSSGDAKLLRIKTFWAHPIDFKFQPSPTELCHFCSDFRYGIYGYGELDVEVIRYPGAIGVEETGDGHRARGREATRMCVLCALARLYILKCAVHRFRKLDVLLSQKIFDLYTTQVLAETWDPPLKKGAYSTCSLCPHPASWNCCADQTHDPFRRKLTPIAGEDRGCGLLICDDCHVKVVTDGGRLKAKTVVPAEKGSVRADIEFLFPGSGLHQAYR
ncbi:hypothetical protein EDD36DRAFT_299910 [Exophiala viscosa]|uniref:Zn(2)-C6 fungal-type domain-containing protein n=2 Tax=Exophiala viscosa TaxID=2486360 RepID=A0AAN6IC89_9EURO|nr:hypothetical protein EDD36DRAFT_299910 [Exophiala viscosa]